MSGSQSSKIKMSSAGSSGEDYIARCLRQIQQDINQGTFVGWATEEEIAARREDMDLNLREEIGRAAPHQSVGSRQSNTTFVGSINPQRVFSHRMPGMVPPQEDPHRGPILAEAHRVTDQFCEEFRLLKAEVALLEAENLELRRQLQHFWMPNQIIPPSSSKNQA